MGTGAQLHAVGDMHGVSKVCVSRVVDGLVNDLVLPHMVSWPEDIADVVRRFHEVAEMPLVCGIVDGTLIKVDAPSDHEEQFVDRRRNHSINVMVVAGPDL